jgi:transporter family protein
MRYLHWAVLALVSYTLVAPLLSVITREVPSDVTALITNSVLIIAALGLVLYRDRPVLKYLDPGHPQAVPMYVAGVLLAVGILAYYRALSTGPVSVVVPIFGMFIVTSSIVGFAFLEESITARKLAGIGFAALAVYLTSVE